MTCVIPNSGATHRRLQWLFASALLFFGIFVASTASPIPSHIPQCAGARAIGARTSLASVARESKPDSTTSAAPPVLFAAVILLAPLLAPRLRLERMTAPVVRLIVRSSLFRPSLLFRPPPAVSLA